MLTNQCAVENLRNQPKVYQILMFNSSTNTAPQLFKLIIEIGGILFFSFSLKGADAELK